ncbi:MAG TPA: S24 family peptidase [Gemmatimonadaceae bacterium]
MMYPNDGAETELFWADFAAEARALTAIDPEVMNEEQVERLEAISDAFIHLIAYVSDAGVIESSRDRQLVEELARRRTREARRTARRTGLTEDDRDALRRRILAELHSGRLRVREAATLPSRYRLDVPRLVTPELLREVDRRRHAVVVPELAIAAGSGCELWDVECDTTIELSADLPHGPYIALEVTGESMEPLLHSGDTVLVRLEERATTGSVVVARDPEHGYVVKEVGRLTAHGIELLSLNPDFPSLRVPHGTGTVLGTVVMKWCPHTASRAAALGFGRQ